MKDKNNINNIVSDVSAFSIHTFTLRLTLNSLEYSKLSEYLKRHHSKAYIKKNFLVSEMLTDFGIGIHLLCTKLPQDYYIYTLELRINAIKLQEKNENYSPTDVFEPTPYNVWRLIENFEVVIEEISKLLPSIFATDTGTLKINYFRLHRIDYCVNITFKNDDIAKIVMKTIKKSYVLCGRYKKVKIGAYYDYKQHRKVKYKHALVLQGGYFTLQIYDKLEQIKDNIGHFKIIPPEAVGLIRAELQVKQGKVEQLMKKYFGNQVDVEDLLLKSGIIAQTEINYYLKNIWGKGKYFSRAQIECILNEKTGKESFDFWKVQDYLIKVLATRSVEKSFEFYGVEEKNKILEIFEKLEINPYPLPDRSSRKIRGTLPPLIEILNRDF